VRTAAAASDPPTRTASGTFRDARRFVMGEPFR
jgi:hypothetical protein